MNLIWMSFCSRLDIRFKQKKRKRKNWKKLQSNTKTDTPRACACICLPPTLLLISSFCLCDNASLAKRLAKVHFSNFVYFMSLRVTILKKPLKNKWTEHKLPAARWDVIYYTVNNEINDHTDRLNVQRQTDRQTDRQGGVQIDSIGTQRDLMDR